MTITFPNAIDAMHLLKDVMNVRIHMIAQYVMICLTLEMTGIVTLNHVKMGSSIIKLDAKSVIQLARHVMDQQHITA